MQRSEKESYVIEWNLDMLMNEIQKLRENEFKNKAIAKAKEQNVVEANGQFWTRLNVEDVNGGKCMISLATIWPNVQSKANFMLITSTLGQIKALVELSKNNLETGVILVVGTSSRWQYCLRSNIVARLILHLPTEQI